MSKDDFTLQDLIRNLNGDLAREYDHWHFYINAAIYVRGLHREELSEFFYKAAAGEMEHIKQFGDLIVGLGGTPCYGIAPMFKEKSPGQPVTDPAELVKLALEMEETVVANYYQRMNECEHLEKVSSLNQQGFLDIAKHARWVHLFLENQMVDSRTDADHLRQMSF